MARRPARTIALAPPRRVPRPPANTATTSLSTMATGFIEVADQREREASDSHIPPHARGDSRPAGDRVREPVGIHQLRCRCASPTPLPAAATATDDTTVPSGWRNASVNVNLQGTGVQGFEWKIDCGTTQTGATANDHRHRHAQLPAPRPGVGHRRLDRRGSRTSSTSTRRSRSTPRRVPRGWQHDKATITLSGTDIGDQSGVSHMVYELDGDGPTAGQRRRHLRHHRQRHAHAAHERRRPRGQRRAAWTTYIVQVDSAGPVDTTTVPAGWVTTPSVDVSVSGTDTGGSGVTQIEWELVEDARSGDRRRRRPGRRDRQRRGRAHAPHAPHRR